VVKKVDDYWLKQTQRGLKLIRPKYICCAIIVSIYKKKLSALGGGEFLWFIRQVIKIFYFHLPYSSWRKSIIIFASSAVIRAPFVFFILITVASHSAFVFFFDLGLLIEWHLLHMLSNTCPGSIFSHSFDASAWFQKPDTNIAQPITKDINTFFICFSSFGIHFLRFMLYRSDLSDSCYGPFLLWYAGKSFNFF